MSDLPTPPNQPPDDMHDAGERKSPRVILPDATARTVVETIETAVPVAHARRPFFGFVASLGLGLVGAAIWAVITLVTDYQIGIVAIVIGLLAGAGARKGGPGRGAQWTGAICAALAYFVGQTVIVAAMVLMHPESLELDDGAGPPTETATQPAESSEPGASDSQAPGAHADSSQPQDWVKSLNDLHPAVRFAIVLIPAFIGAVVETFSSLGIVFLGIAVYEGYKIPRAG